MSKEKPKQEKDEEEKPSKEQELIELTDLLKRNQAEFENYRTRIETQRKELVIMANKELILKLLPLLDSFELAFNNKDKSIEFLKGMELIYSQFFQVLEDEGLKPMDTENHQFNPNLHEALLTEKHDDKENELILENLQKGFMLGDKVLRHAKVKINKK